MDNRQQDARELKEQRYRVACAAFEADEISIDVFRATLHGIGYRGQELESEVSLHWPFKTIGQAAQQAVKTTDDARKFVSGLEDAR